MALLHRGAVVASTPSMPCEPPVRPLATATARLLWLQSCCAVAEGAAVPLSDAIHDASPRCPPDVCVAVVLGDALRHVSVLGGREGMPRSLGSV
jgi:hypothetical protein